MNIPHKKQQTAEMHYLAASAKNIIKGNKKSCILLKPFANKLLTNKKAVYV